MNDAGNWRIAVVLSHPIQHFCPQYVSWARLPGIDLHVFFASRHGLSAYQDDGFGQTVTWQGLSLDFPHTFLPGADERAITAALDAAALDDELRKFAPDVVVVYGYGQRLQRRAAAWAAQHNVPTLMVSDSTTHEHVPWWKRTRKALLLPRIYRKVGAFLTVGDSNEAHYRHYGVPDTRMVRCPFPIDVRRYDQVLAERSAARHRVRAELGIPENHAVILTVGKLVPWKRQVDLVQFSNACQGQRNDVTIIIAGSGRDEAQLRGKAERVGPGGVIFAGFVQPGHLPAYYCAADVYAHCSTRERHSLAISEAIYAGLPVVLSERCGSYGPTDDVRVGTNGFVYAFGNLNDLSSKLALLLGDPWLCESMGQASRNIALSNQRLAHGAGLLQALHALSASNPCRARKALQHSAPPTNVGATE